jgi:hypothetical protein
MLTVLIALVIGIGALAISANPGWIVAILAGVGAWLAWGLLNAAWFSTEVSVLKHILHPHEGISKPRSPLKTGSMGSEDIGGVDIETSRIFNLLGIDVATLVIITRDGQTLRIKHVPDAFNARALLNNVQTQGGPSTEQELLLLLVMHAVLGTLTDRMVDNVIGDGTVHRWRRESAGGDSPPDIPQWPYGPPDDEEE